MEWFDVINMNKIELVDNCYLYCFSDIALQKWKPGLNKFVVKGWPCPQTMKVTVEFISLELTVGGTKHPPMCIHLTNKIVLSNPKQSLNKREGGWENYRKQCYSLTERWRMAPLGGSRPVLLVRRNKVGGASSQGYYN